jgi:hypothetical protein
MYNSERYFLDCGSGSSTVKRYGRRSRAVVRITQPSAAPAPRAPHRAARTRHAASTQDVFEHGPVLPSGRVRFGFLQIVSYQEKTNTYTQASITAQPLLPDNAEYRALSRAGSTRSRLLLFQSDVKSVLKRSGQE